MYIYTFMFSWLTYLNKHCHGDNYKPHLAGEMFALSLICSKE